MKKIVTVTEVDGEGLVGLLGKRVLLLCANYFYSGVLAGVNTVDVLLEDAAIVYDTGPWANKDFADEQKVGGSMYVRVASIEAYKEI